MSAPALRQATPADWHAIREMLQAADLPVADLGPDSLGGFTVAELDGELVGFIGLQRAGSAGLLRSLVVAEETRGGGLGRRLVVALEAAARAAGIADVWLLTIDAEAYFQGLGFRTVERSAAPGDIQLTEEFSTLCPAAAPLMRKILA